MTAVRTARERARAELTQEIKDVARRHLAATGAAELSLRAVAREMEVASSALYRYFPSRDALLTALIIDAFDAVGDRAQAAADAVGERDFRGRWLAVCHAVRAWAHASPHEYALVYGSPVPGYSAPEDTVAAGTRIPFLLIGIVRDAAAAGALADVGGSPLPADLVPQLAHLADGMDIDGVPAPVVLRALTAWTQLFGVVSAELFGHLVGAFTDDAPFFAASVDLMADGIGLRASSARTSRSGTAG